MAQGDAKPAAAPVDVEMMDAEPTPSAEVKPDPVTAEGRDADLAAEASAAPVKPEVGAAMEAKPEAPAGAAVAQDTASPMEGGNGAAYVKPEPLAVPEPKHSAASEPKPGCEVVSSSEPVSIPEPAAEPKSASVRENPELALVPEPVAVPNPATEHAQPQQQQPEPTPDSSEQRISPHAPVSVSTATMAPEAHQDVAQSSEAAPVLGSAPETVPPPAAAADMHPVPQQAVQVDVAPVPASKPHSAPVPPADHSTVAVAGVQADGGVGYNPAPGGIVMAPAAEQAQGLVLNANARVLADEAQEAEP